MAAEKLNEVYCTTTREPGLQGSGPLINQILTIFYFFKGKGFQKGLLSLAYRIEPHSISLFRL